MDARAVRAATVIAACRRGQLGRRAVRAQLLAAAHGRSVRVRARQVLRQAERQAARSANLERHVRRHRAAAIPDRSARVAASAAPARQPASAGGRPTPQEVGETCDELREWLVRCPGSAEISSLLAECEGAALASAMAPAGTDELLETVAELERFASAANGASTAALLDECVTELERRRAAARPAPLGELQRTATELRRLVASTTGGQYNSELHSMLSQTEAEIGRRHARRGK